MRVVKRGRHAVTPSVLVKCSLVAALLSGMDSFAQLEPQIPDPVRQLENTLRDERYFDERRDEAGPVQGAVVIESGAQAAGILPETDDVFELSDIRFSNSEFINTETLESIAAPYQNRTIGFAEINEMIGMINAIYAERGIVSARAIVPPQTIDDGVLQVRLVEGRLGELVIQGNDRVKSEFISDRLSVARGEVVNVPELREELTRLNRTTELMVQTALRAGQEPGATDLLLSVQEPRRWDTQVFVDNLGTDSTGENRIGAFARWYSPLGRDDRLTLYVVGGEGAANVFAGYSVPVTRSGGRLEANFSHGTIDIIEGPFVDLEIAGKSTSYALKYNHPWLRGDRYWLDLHGSTSMANSSTDLLSSALSEFSISRHEIGATIQGFGNRLVWRLTQNLASADAEDIFGMSDPRMLYTGNATVLYRVFNRVNARIAGAWQFSDEETVASPLLFQIGGVSSVRGYVNGAVAGAMGYYVNLEASYGLSQNLQPFVFYDMGYVDDISPSEVNISSAGIGLNWQYGRHFTGEITWAQTLDDVFPDQDSGRLLLRVSYTWPR